MENYVLDLQLAAATGEIAAAVAPADEGMLGSLANGVGSRGSSGRSVNDGGWWQKQRQKVVC